MDESPPSPSALGHVFVLRPPSPGKKESITPPEPIDVSHIDPSLRLNLDEIPTDNIYRVEVTLLPCAVCGRTFSPESLAKHVTICLKTTTNKRHQFDSSGQRSKGTEIQYLPRNFGLSQSSLNSDKERSKTPPSTNRMYNKSKAHNLQSTHSRLLATADNSPCPHCGRSFGARAIDRHVVWCAEQARLARGPGGNSTGPENLRMARERLFARTSYRAPLYRSKRSINREKYSLSRSASEGSGMSDRSFDESKVVRGSADEHNKHLPSINRTPNNSSQSARNSLPRNHKKSGVDDSYDPYLAAEKQFNDLMSSTSNLTKLDLSLDIRRDSSPFSDIHKPTLHSSPKSKENSMLNNNIVSPNFQRSKSLRSPPKSRYTTDTPSKYSSSLAKPNTYSLSSILNSNKSPQSTEKSKNTTKMDFKDNPSKSKVESSRSKQSSNYNNDDQSYRNYKKHHSIKLEPVDKGKRKDDNHNDYTPNLNNHLSESQEYFIDPRLINKDQPLPISVQKFLDNPDLLSSEESLLRENLSKKIDSYADYVKNKTNKKYSRENSRSPLSDNTEPTTPQIDNLSDQYDKIMITIEESINSRMSSQDEDAIYNDLEKMISSMDNESSSVHNGMYSFSANNNSKLSCKDALDGLNIKNNKLNSNVKNNERSQQKNVPYNKSISLNFSPIVNKQSLANTRSSQLNSKPNHNSETNNKSSNHNNPDKKSNESQLEQDIMQSLKDIDKICDKNLSDSDETGGFMSLKRRENYFNENNYYAQDADISHYLPKNLGLTDESPFLESEKSVDREKIGNKLKDEISLELCDKLFTAMKNVCCPSCGHNFDIQKWYAQQVSSPKSPQSYEEDYVSRKSYNKPMTRSFTFNPSLRTNNFN